MVPPVAHQVRVQVKDSGPSAGYAGVQVLVNNVSPTAVLTGGDGLITVPIAFTLAQAFDPSQADGASLHYAFSCNGAWTNAPDYANSSTNATTSCTYSAVGSYTVFARVIDKNGGYSQYQLPVKATADATTIFYSGPALAANGATITLTGTLFDKSTPLAGQTVTLKLGTQTCTAVTNAYGIASCSITALSQVLGPTPVVVSYAGSGFHLPSSTTGSTLVYAFLPGGGSFVIADTTAKVGNSVTFWGAQWWKLNAPSGGTGPAAFKGFADVAPSACGGTFTTRPGNSSKPPDTVPAYVAVIASSTIGQSGSNISGTAPKMVIVKYSGSGYAGDPGHAGTGTVVATLCDPVTVTSR